MSGTVSIAMATCNGAAFVDAQLASIAVQTRLPDEIVVCDDASDDDTCARIEAFARAAPFPVRLERGETRLGITGNFERAFAACRGDIVFFADQDDLWRPEKIETLAGSLDRTPDVDLIFSNGRAVDAMGQPLGFDLWESLSFTRDEQRRVATGRATEVFVKHVVAAGTTMAFRSRHRALLLPFPDLHSCHDAWVAFLLACVSGVTVIDEPLIDYRLHGANQIGIQKLGFRGQLAKAREQIELGLFDYAVRFFEQARERLSGEAASGLVIEPHVLEVVERKLDHARRRAALPASWLRRLPDVARETLNGGYWRYSYGAKSAAQDLLLR